MKTGCCTICLEPLFKDLQVTSCGHVYHRTCIYRWLDAADECSCPNCKTHIDASTLTKLYLKPTEMIKEVLHDPSVLESADPELLLQITAGQFGGGSDSDGGDTDCDVDLNKLDLTKSPKSKRSKKTRMELVSIKIKNTALQRQVEDLQTSTTQLKAEKRSLEDSKSKMNRKLASYLRTARVYEDKFFELEEQLKANNLTLFKRNKELNHVRKELHTVNQRHAMCAHCEQIEIGNFDGVQQIEHEVASKSSEEQAKYYQGMYQWMLKEYKRSQSDRERDKLEHVATRKKLGEIHEDQRATIAEMQEMGSANLAKIERYKKHYFDLKAKYLKVKDQGKALRERYEALKAQRQNGSFTADRGPSAAEINVLADDGHRDGDRDGGGGPMENVVERKEEGQDGDGDGNGNGQRFDDDLNSISYEDDQENLAPKTQDIASSRRDEQTEDEDEDLKILHNVNHRNTAAIDGGALLNESGVFSIPNDGAMGFRRSASSRGNNQGANALFGAYRQIKHRRDGPGNGHSFGRHPNMTRKRNFSHFAKGSDGRGGTANFLTQNANAHNHKNKKRRVVKSSTSSNQNRNAMNSKKANIASYFQRNRKNQ